MKVTVHTPGVKVDEYDVAERFFYEPDDVIITAVQRKKPGATSFEVTGDPAVYSRGGDPIKEAAQRFTSAQEALKKAKADAAALLGGDDVGVSERELGRMFGVDRLTIRSWRGKGR